jgi:hypothetical protein
MDRTVAATKTGQTSDFDSAIVAILKQADEEKRELSLEEQQAVVSLKVARTRTGMAK